MDIDEFLDEEIQGEKKGDAEKEAGVSEAVKEESAEKPADEAVKEEKDNVKRYFELWNKVSEAKFRWDSSLYAELDKASSKVKEELDKSLSAMERKKKEIKRLIGKVLNELENKNYDAATRLYSEISDMRNSFPEFLLEQKKELNKEIFLLYEKLHGQIDSKFINDLKDSIAKIDNLIHDSYSSFNGGDIDKAKIFYEKALELYKGLPNGFLSRKMELGTKLLALYKDISIYIEIKSLEQQLAKKPVEKYRYTSSDDELKRLSEIIKSKEKTQMQFSPPPDLRISQSMQPMQNKTLLSKLIARKLDRAKINLKKGLYFEARKNLGSVLRVDPENEEAKQMLNSIPVEY